MLRNALVIGLSTLVVSSGSGCTLVGLGIGATIPKKTTYGEESPAGPALERAVADEKLEEGDHVVLTVSQAPAQLDGAPPPAVEEGADVGPPPPPAPPGGKPRKVIGDFRSLRGGILALDNDNYYAEVPLDRVETARVSHGSYWLSGMLIGFGVDATVAAVVAVTILSAFGNIR